MPAAADITVKKYDNTTDQIWSLIAPSSGDKGAPAWWKNNTQPGTVGQKPAFTIASRSSGQSGESRRVDFKLSFPSVYTETTTSLTKVRSTAVFTGSMVIPQDMALADIQECCGQLGHLMASSLVISSMVNGQAPT